MIYLINMPFYCGYKPNLALSLIKALLNRAGLRSKVLDMQLTMTKHMGHDSYNAISSDVILSTLLGLYFTNLLWGDDFGTKTHAYVEGVIKTSLPEDYVINNDQWRDNFKNKSIPFLLQSTYDLIDCFGHPDVIGFSCNAMQIMPSLVLGKRIKQKYPKTKLVYGGACFHGEMGREHIEKIPWIDAVSTGEADDIVVDLFYTLCQGTPPAGLKGVIYRQNDGTVKSGPAYRNISQKLFESLPSPDYDDFFEMAKHSGCNADTHWKANLHLNYESSRGCYWGQKCVCMFCGLNGSNINYRVKSADKVYTELSSCIDKYGVRNFVATDNIIPYDYFKTLLPNLIKHPFNQPISLSYEVRADLNREQIITMVRAGIHEVQVGIENLSTHLLKLLRKGTTAIHNIYFLKLCRQYGITPFWIQMVRIPGEQPKYYEWIEELVPKITHFHPPSKGTYIKVELERFSPYYSEKKMVRNIIPKPRYAHMYPAERFDLNKLAYSFDADWENTLGDDAYCGLKDVMERWALIWRDQGQLPNLSLKEGDEDQQLTITDTRISTRPLKITLEAEQAAVYQMLNDPISLRALMMRLKAHNMPKLCDSHHLRDILDEFIAQDLVVEEKNIYIGLALPDDVPDLPIGKRF